MRIGDYVVTAEPQGLTTIRAIGIQLLFARRRC
jgi:hypothetical protein